MMNKRTRIVIFTLIVLVLVSVVAVGAYAMTATDKSARSKTPIARDHETRDTSPHWVKPPITASTAPPITSPYHLPAYKTLFTLQTSGGISGRGLGELIIGIDGTWTITRKASEADPENFQLAASGSLTNDQLKKLKAIITSDTEKLFDDKSLIAMCKPSPPDELTFTFSYMVDGNSEMDFDSCWIKSNDDQQLIIVTAEILGDIWSQAGLSF